MVRAMGTRQCGFGFRTHRPDHSRTQRLTPLAEDKTDPAGCCVNEDRVTPLHSIGLFQQVLRRHPLQHHHGADLKREVVG